MSKIILADDDDDLREIMVDSLCHAGHEVTAFNNGRKALAAVDQVNPDVVVTDVVMDDGEGIQFIIKLRERSNSLRIVTISGQAPYLEYAAKLGANATLLKPFHIRALIEAVEQV